jgi:hypothetical protein
MENLPAMCPSKVSVSNNPSRARVRYRFTWRHRVVAEGLTLSKSTAHAIL